MELTETPKDESQSLEHIFLENPNIVNLRDLPSIKEVYNSKFIICKFFKFFFWVLILINTCRKGLM
jgi:hypothetical protein